MYLLEMVFRYRTGSEWVAWRYQRSAVVLVYCITCIVDHTTMVRASHVFMTGIRSRPRKPGIWIGSISFCRRVSIAFCTCTFDSSIQYGETTRSWDIRCWESSLDRGWGIDAECPRSFPGSWRFEELVDDSSSRLVELGRSWRLVCYHSLSMAVQRENNVI